MCHKEEQEQKSAQIMKYPGKLPGSLPTYTEIEVNEWIRIARAYVRTDRKIPIAMFDIMKEFMIHDPRLGLYFFREVRKYPALKSHLVSALDHTEPEPPAYDDPSLLNHPGTNKITHDRMFR